MTKEEIALNALNQIAYPMRYLQQEAVKHGAIFDGRMALEITKDAQYYQDVALNALREMEEHDGQKESN